MEELSSLYMSYCQVSVEISQKLGICHVRKPVSRDRRILTMEIEVGKVCSLNFEPPDNDLCSACHVYPLSRGAWIISILFILNRFTWGLNYII